MEGEFDKWVAGRRGVCVFSWEWHTHLLRPSYITDFRTQPEAASNATIRAVVFGGGVGPPAQRMGAQRCIQFSGWELSSVYSQNTIT